MHFGYQVGKACLGHNETGNILKPSGYQCRAFLSIWTACCPTQANVNSAVTSAQALQISSLIPPAGSWNQRRGHARDGESGGSSELFYIFYYISFFFCGNSLFMKCSLFGAVMYNSDFKRLSCIYSRVCRWYAYSSTCICSARGLAGVRKYISEWNI